MSRGTPRQDGGEQCRQGREDTPLAVRSEISGPQAQDAHVRPARPRNQGCRLSECPRPASQPPRPARTRGTGRARNNHAKNDIHRFIYTECTHGCSRHGRTKQRPALPPPPGRPSLRQEQRQRQGRRQGQGKAARGTYRRRPGRAPARRRAPIVGASRNLSREPALTGPVRQRQAAAATRQPHPKASRPRAPRPPPPGPRHPLNRQGPGDRGTHGRPGSKVARSGIAAGDATRERP
jgi:hypothetical protein